MSRNHKTLITKVALTAFISILATTALPGHTSQVSAATIVASAPNKTAPGQPKFGEAGPAVVAVQNAIMKNGFTLRGGATGKFDVRTRTVLRTFQKVVGLKVTGVVDAATARALKLNSAVPNTPANPATPVAVAAPAAAPVSSGPFITKLPKRGTGSKSVVIVQKALIAAGFQVSGGSDGIFGSSTTRAIATFQKAKNIKATGILDQQTAIALGVMAPPVAVAVAPATPATSTAPIANTAHVSSIPKRGQRSKDVVIVQSALIAAGVTVKGGADGFFGGATSLAISNFQKKSSFSATGQLDVRTALKLGVIPAPTVQLAAFPVQGPCSFSNTWHAPRGDRKHLGVDIIAREGNLIYAVADGTITRVYNEATSKRAGNGVRLTTADGTYFFYAHFQKVADGITVGTKVKAGQVIGYNGKTGNTSTPHLHFEIHPQGGAPIDPTSAVAAVNACHVTAPLPIP
jgi:peptidoglycan hydrolase-like protein with peptidoglycan-binding domain